MSRKTGIYKIENKINGKVYIGQSVNVARRESEHFNDLRKRRHANHHLQNSFDKYGENSFEFSLVCECQESELNESEQRAIDEHIKSFGVYNIVKYVDDVRGEKNPFFGKKHKTDSKEKMSLWKKANYIGSANPNFGKKQNESVKKKMSEGRGNLSVEIVLQIVDRLKQGESHEQIAKDCGTGRTTITRISNGTRWSNVTGGPIIPVVYKDGKRILNNDHKVKIGKGRKGKKHSDETKHLMKIKALNRRKSLQER